MVTDEQVRRLRKLSNTEKNQEIAASKAGMDPTTARRYRGLERAMYVVRHVPHLDHLRHVMSIQTCPAHVHRIAAAELPAHSTERRACEPDRARRTLISPGAARKGLPTF